MFSQCESIADIKALGNWNVSKGTNFINIFSSCHPSIDLKPLQKWNVNFECNII